VIPAPFAYRRAESVAEAIELLGEHGDEAKVLAGGHSLLPMMKLRFARPELVIDIGDLPGLDYIRPEGGEIAIGALARHVALETSPLLAVATPLLQHAASAVGDCQVRHRGTIGGSVAHGDPAADFYVGFLETALQPDELVVELRVPRAEGLPWGFQKFRRRAIDWAVVGIAYQAEPGGGGIGLVSMGPTTLRAASAESALRSGAPAGDVAQLADADAEPAGDAAVTPEFRRHLARTLLARALAGEAAR
jgi:carbon-monoxide dehydrogenase medium subunit